MPLKRNNTSSIAFKLATSLGLIASLYLCALISFYLLVKLPEAAQVHRNKIEQIISSFHTASAQAVFDLDGASAAQVVNGFSFYPFVYRAKILQDNGKTLAERTFQQTPQELPAFLFRLIHYPEHLSYSRELTDPRIPSGPYGTLIVEINQHIALQPVINEIVTLIKTDVLQIGLFMVLIYISVYRIVAGPLRRITRELQQIPPSNPNQKRLKTCQDKDEIAALIAQINSFIESTENQIKAKDDAQSALLELAQNLDQLVQQRTAELESARESAERARDAADTANRAKSVFLSNMSHELRTPLNSIIGFTYRILNSHKVSLPKRERDALQTVYNNGRHLLAIINDLLDIAKIEAQRMELNCSKIHLNPVISDAIKSLQPIAEQHHIALIYDDEDDLELEADPLKLKQILMNLVGNGIKYTEQGSVTIKSCEKGLFIEIAVIDTGIGIDEANHHKLFDPYNHFHSQLNKQASIESTGLGLPLSYQLAVMHQGTIKVQSQLGKGSTFTLVLPKHQQETPDPKPLKAAS